SPRIYSNGSRYNGVAYLEKTGATNDGSTGANYFADSLFLINSGSGYILFGNGSPDSCMSYVYLENNGTDNLHFAYNSAGNYIDGNLDVVQPASGAGVRIYISNQAASTLDVTGNVICTNASTSNNSYLYLGDDGDVNIMGDLTLDLSTSVGNAGYIYVASSTNSVVSVAGNCTVLNDGSNNTEYMYLANVGQFNISGSLNIDNSGTGTNSQIILANNVSSSAYVGGDIIVNNDGTATNIVRTYLGNAGQLTVDGITDINNSSGSNNSQVFCADNGTVFFNGDIRVEASDVACDGVYFGNGGGTSVLAATKTITI